MGKDLTKVTHTIFICNGGSCKKQGAEDNVRELRCALKMEGLQETIHTIKTLCMGQCENAPVMFVEGDNTWYKRMTADMIHELVGMSLNSAKALKSNALFKRGWDKMQPAKVVIPKTNGSLQWEEDPEMGRINSIQIYPWEFNTYPLLKECFTNRWEELSLFSKAYGLMKGPFQMEYQPGKALIDTTEKDVSLEIVMQAAKDSEDFPAKVSSIKLFHTAGEEQYGLHFSNPKDGVILKVRWDKNNGFWEHLINNYAKISS